jgi:aryl-alcohol dehydrogenase-like predicted oxidoreductase
MVSTQSTSGSAKRWWCVCGAGPASRGGVVAGIGIGVNEADTCVRFAQAGSFDTMLLAGRYSLLEQPALAEFLPLAQQQ